MKEKKLKESRQVRISLKAYEQVRRVAYRLHRPMTEIIEEILEINLK